MVVLPLAAQADTSPGPAPATSAAPDASQDPLWLAARQAADADARLRADHPTLFGADSAIDLTGFEGQPFRTLSQAMTTLAIDRIRVAVGAAEGQDDQPLGGDVAAWLREYIGHAQARYDAAVQDLALARLPADPVRLEDALWAALAVPDLKVQLAFLQPALRTFEHVAPGTMTFAMLKVSAPLVESVLVQLELFPVAAPFDGPALSPQGAAALRNRVSFRSPSSLVRPTDIVQSVADAAAARNHTAIAVVFTAYGERVYHQAVAREVGFRQGADLMAPLRERQARWAGAAPSFLLQQAQEAAAGLEGALPDDAAATSNNAAAMAALALGGFATVELVRGAPTSAASGGFQALPSGQVVLLALVLATVVAATRMERGARAGRDSSAPE